MVRDAKTILAFMRSTDMQKGEPTCRVGRPRCKKQFCISDSHPCMSASYYHVLPQNVVFASRTATLACRPSYSTFTILLFYYLSILLFYYFTPDTVLPRPMFRVGCPRCKKTFLHLGQPPLHVGPPILLIYYFAPDTVLPRPMFGVGRPRCKKVFHVLPRTTTYTATYYSRT